MVGDDPLCDYLLCRGGTAWFWSSHGGALLGGCCYPIAAVGCRVAVALIGWLSPKALSRLRATGRLAGSWALTIATTVATLPTPALNANLRGKAAVVKAFQPALFDGRPQDRFNVTNHRGIFLHGEGERFAGGMGAPGAANAVGVGIDRIGHVEVDHM